MATYGRKTEFNWTQVIQDTRFKTEFILNIEFDLQFAIPAQDTPFPLVLNQKL